MFKDKRFQEITGIVLILGAIILFLSIFTFRLSDYSLLQAGSPVSNLIGPLGAGLSHALRSGLGLSAYIIAAMLAFAGWTVIRTGETSALPERIFAFFFLAITFSALAGMISPDIPQESGGYTGCGIAGFLTRALGKVGAFLIITILNIMGLILLGAFSMTSLINRASEAEKKISGKGIQPFAMIKNIPGLLLSAVSRRKTDPSEAEQAETDDIPLNSICQEGVKESQAAETVYKKEKPAKKNYIPWITKEKVLVEEKRFGFFRIVEKDKPVSEPAPVLLKLPEPVPAWDAGSFSISMGAENLHGSAFADISRTSADYSSAFSGFACGPGRILDPIPAEADIYDSPETDQDETENFAMAAMEKFAESEELAEQVSMKIPEYDTVLTAEPADDAVFSPSACSTENFYFEEEQKELPEDEEVIIHSSRLSMEEDSGTDMAEEFRPNRIISISEEDESCEEKICSEEPVSAKNRSSFKTFSPEKNSADSGKEQTEHTGKQASAQIHRALLTDHNREEDPFDDINTKDLSRPVTMFFEKLNIGKYDVPLSFFHMSVPPDTGKWKEEMSRNSQRLVNALAEFRVEAKVVEVHRGPVITRYEITLAPGTPVQRVTGLSDNLAMNLAAETIRVVAPVPGKSTVGIELPNRERETVTLGDILKSRKYNDTSCSLKVGLGKDISGNTVTIDLKKQPHLLIAGATGSGKSVCVNTIISSLIYRYDPNCVRFILVDPKMVELQMYNGIPHLLTPVITEPAVTPSVLKWAICEMERRYRLLSSMNTRDIEIYNQKVKGTGGESLPYIVIIIDELADLMMVASKEIENYITRLAQKARAIGIHLVLATQRPSVDVITGVIKANFPARIAFQVAQKNDSRTILDRNGAEKLLGQGDMLYQSPTKSFPVRIQGAFISEEEISGMVEYLEKYGDPVYIDIEQALFDATESSREEDGCDDELFLDALKIVEETRKASASYLQRRLSIGYNRAARIIELMESRGYIGPQQGSRPREVYI